MRVPISEFYTNIPDLQEEVAHVLIIYSFYHLLDGNKAVSSGIMRGLAKQAPASIVSMISYYVVSLPFQYLFGFRLAQGVSGLWEGQMVAAAFHLCSLLVLLYRFYDWNAISVETQLRVERELQEEKSRCEMKTLLAV